jgi:GGDEF domain-containing protein
MEHSNLELTQTGERSELGSAESVSVSSKRVAPVTGPRAPRWGVHALLALATLLVAAGTVVSGDASSSYPLLYVCVAACAFYLLDGIDAAFQAALIFAAYGAALAMLPGRAPSRVAVHAGVLFVSVWFAGLVVAALRVKQQRLVERLSDSGSHADAWSRLLDSHGLDRVLAVEAERSGRSGIPFALIACAVDSIDLRSRDARSSAASRLTTVAAKAVRGAIRHTDFVGRLGPNLVAIVAIYTDERAAAAMVERVRELARDSGGAEENLSLSFGIAIFPRNGDSPLTLLEAAESALEAARDLGGERSLVATRMVSSSSTGIEKRSAEVRVAPTGP